MSLPVATLLIAAQDTFRPISIGGSLFLNLIYLSTASLAVMLSAILIFGGACYLVATRRKPAVLAAFLVFLPLPVLIAICGVLWGSINTLVVIESNPKIELTTGQLAGGYAVALTEILFAFIVTAPSYFVLAFGLLKRSIIPPTDSTQSLSPRRQSHQLSFDANGPKPATN